MQLLARRGRICAPLCLSPHKAPFEKTALQGAEPTLYLGACQQSKVPPLPVEASEPITDATRRPSHIPMLTALRRGIARRCPACGEGPVLAGYLSRLPSCNVCGEDLSHIRADDGPAWATLIVVGHLLAPLMIILGRDESIPVWTAILLLSAAMLAGVWVCLPRAQGLFIALIWRTGATGEDVFTHPASQKDDGNGGVAR